jgi:hypothetical protein
MPQVTSISGVSGYVPGGQASSPDQIDFVGLAQAMLQMKREKKSQEQQEAVNRLNTVQGMIKQGLQPSPEMLQQMQKDFKILDIDPKVLTANAQSVQPVQPQQQEAQQQPTNAPVAQPMPQVNSQAVSAVGNATQGNKAGAQAATPPSDSAAKKAPGGGVNTSGAMTPGGGQFEKAFNQASEGGTQPAMQSDPYAAVRSPQAMQQSYNNAMEMWQGMAATGFQKNQAEGMMADLQRRAMGGDDEALGRFLQLSGMNIPTDMMMFLRANPQQKAAMLSFAAGQETPAQAILRESNTRQMLMQQYGGVLDIPQIEEVTKSIMAGQGIPPGIAQKISTIQSRFKEAEFFYKFAQILPVKYAAAAAQAAAHGLNANLVLPSGMQSLSEMTLKIEQQKANAMSAQVGVERERNQMMKTKAEMDAFNDYNKIMNEMQKQENEQLMKTLNSLIDMEKADMDVDKTILNETIGKVALQVGVSTERVEGFWSFITGPKYKFSPIKTDTSKFTGQPQTNPDTGASLTDPGVIGAAAYDTASDIGAGGLPYIQKGLEGLAGATGEFVKGFKKRGEEKKKEKK